MRLNKFYLNSKKIKNGLRTISIVLIFMLLSACLQNSPDTIQEGDLLAVATITKNADSLLEQSVLVRSDIAKKIGKRGFILDQDQVFAGQSLLVIDISKQNFTFPQRNDESPEVVIQGELKRFVFKKINNKYGLNLDFALYSPYENQLVILAKSIILSPDPSDIARYPEIYRGKQLAIKGEVEDVQKYGIFELDEEKVFGGEDLLVLQVQSRIKLDDDKIAIVYGTLRPLIAAELEKEYNLGWDLSTQKQIEAKYSQKPILIAEEIQFVNP